GLAELAVARVDVAADQVRVAALDLDRVQRDHLAARRGEVLHVRLQLAEHALDISGGQRIGPLAVADLDLPGGVPAHVPRHLLELDPDHALALGDAGRVDPGGLADHHGRRGGQVAGGGRGAGEGDVGGTVGEVDDRRVVEARVAPAHRLVQRDVDLHPAAPAVAVGLAGGDRLGGRVARPEQPAVELGRGDVGDHRTARHDLLAA